MDLREIGWNGLDWMHIVQDGALVNTVMNLRNSIKGGKFLD
jgi:hypothetical protein